MCRKVVAKHSINPIQQTSIPPLIISLVNLWDLGTYRGVADKLGHQVNSDSYAHISSIASYTHNFCVFVLSCFAHDFSSMEEDCSNVNDLLQTNILFTILIRLENPSSASSDSSIIPFLLLSEARLV